MEIIVKSEITTFSQMGLGMVFKGGNDYFMRIEDALYKEDVRLLNDGGCVTRNAFRLKDGKLYFFTPDEPVVPVMGCKLVIE